MNNIKADTSAARFADNARARRELLGKSQEDIAQGMRDLGFDSFRQQTVTAVESGGRQIKLDEASAWARLLGVTLDALMRPAGLARQANALISAATDLLNASREETRWAAEAESSYRRVTKAITAAADYEAELANELAVARRAIKATGRS